MNWVDILIVVIVLVGVLGGLRRGFLRGALDIVFVAVALLAGAVGYRWAAALLERFLGHPGVAMNVLGFALVALVVQGIFSLVIGATIGPGIAVVRVFPPARRLDEVLGVVPGLVKGVVVAGLVVLAMSLLPLGARAENALRGSQLANDLLVRSAQATSWAQARTGLDLSDFTVMIEPKGEAGYTLPFTVTEGLEVSPADEQEMLLLVNEARRQHGLAPLSVDPALQQVARQHSEEMFRLGYFSHTSPVTGSPADRLNAAGISYAAAGENLAYAPTVEIAQRGLMQSEGHRANILSADFQRIGIGVIVSPTGNKMFTQEFAGG